MEDCGHMPVWTGQRVERTNARGRHSYCTAFKVWIVEQALRPGMSMAGLAMRNQVNANQLRRWVALRRRAMYPASSPALLPVTIAPEPMPMPVVAERAEEAVEIDMANVTVRVRAGVQPATLRTVLEVLRGMGS